MQTGKLMRKPSGRERAWFLEEESELRTKRLFLAGEKPRADVLACLTASCSSDGQACSWAKKTPTSKSYIMAMEMFPLFQMTSVSACMSVFIFIMDVMFSKSDMILK